MNKDYLQDLVDKGLSISEISKECGLTKTPVRYWLKRHGLKTRPKSSLPKVNTGGNKTCPRCKCCKEYEEFYTRRGGNEPSVYCKLCTSDQILERMRKFKDKCVEYCGGVCVVCRYSKCRAAMEFHHLDPSKKDFHVASLRCYRFSEIVKQELDKCVLLCSNCHREVHAGITPVPEQPSKL